MPAKRKRHEPHINRGIGCHVSYRDPRTKTPHRKRFGQAMIWMGIGLGFGQGDLAVATSRSIDRQSYDLRRVKTEHERMARHQ